MSETLGKERRWETTLEITRLNDFALIVFRGSCEFASLSILNFETKRNYMKHLFIVILLLVFF